MSTDFNKSDDSLEKKIKRKPERNRNKTISKIIFEPIVNTLHKIKTSLPIRRNSRVYDGLPLFNDQNPLRKKGGKTRKNRKSKRKQ
jgi:hypothetical protein